MITRRSFSATLAGGAAAVLAAGAQAQSIASDVQSGTTSAAAPRIRNVVLVHGLYADGSCWLDVIGRLQAAGMRTTAVQNGLLTLEADVAATRRALDRQDGPTVLVGHSFAGTIISEAGVHPKVAALAYVSARAPDAAEDYPALGARFPKAPASAGVVTVDGFSQLNEETFLRDFASDVDPVRARSLYAVQQPFATTLMAGRTTVAAWRSKPTWYQVSTSDRTINPDLQRFMAARMKARTLDLDSSHLAMLSHPTDIANMILQAARTA
jgi:pimeloyl-ACP methyl ester carboxylesterase